MGSPNWPAILHQYCAGYIDENGAHKHYTLAELARQHGLAHSTLLSRSCEEKWPAKREEMQRRIYSAALVQFENEMQERLTRADRLATDYGLLVMQAIYDVVAKEPETARERANTAIRFSKTFADAYNLVHTGVGLEQLKDLMEQEGRKVA